MSPAPLEPCAMTPRYLGWPEVNVSGHLRILPVHTRSAAGRWPPDTAPDILSAEMGTPRYDTSRWPLVVVTPSTAPMTDAEFESYLDWMDKLFLRGSKFAVLLDSRHAPALEAKRRQIIGHRHKAIVERYPGRLVAFAFIISSTMQRGIFTAILWITGGAETTRVFSSLSAGEEWLISQLRTAGV